MYVQAGSTLCSEKRLTHVSFHISMENVQIFIEVLANV